MQDLLLPLPTKQSQTTTACLVMVNLVGSTHLARTLPIDHYMTLMTEFIQVMILSFEMRGGQVLQHQGDAVFAYWPQEMALQACQAALETHERARKINLAKMLGINLKVRVGISSGEVIKGFVGGQLSVYGLPVNYTRRLCDAALPTQTLACCKVAAILNTATWPIAKLEQQSPLDLQGFGSECVAYRLLSLPAHAKLSMHMKVD